jgi:hypothetical protein
MRRLATFRRRGHDPLMLAGAGVLIAALGVAGTLHLKGRPATEVSTRLHVAASCHRLVAVSHSFGADGMAVVRQLCCESFAGRKAGMPGADQAATWLAAEFRSMGLATLPGAAGFRQAFTMPVSLVASRWDRKAKVTGPTGATTLIEYPCFYGNGFSEEAEAIFAGAGVSRRDQGWDDYHGRDVRGKYVIYREEAPGPGLDREEHARWRDAKAHGALGCLVLSRQAGAQPAGLESPIRDFPVLRLDAKTARRILGEPAESRLTPAQAISLSRPNAKSPAPSARPLRIDIARADDLARPTANIIGMLPGSDPAVAGEVVILSAHYDHLGAVQAFRHSGVQAFGRSGIRQPQFRTPERRTPERLNGIFPGADDDASGVAVVLGAARALSHASARPRRTILFCLWSAEECGLLGSRDYVDRPLVPLDRTRFVLQVEMVGAGRTDTFETSAAGLGKSGYGALRESAAHLGLTLAGDTCKGVSDHLPFIRRGVPALVLTTTGEHPDYHTCRDTPDRLHPEGIENATQLCTKTIWKVANE